MTTIRRLIGGAAALAAIATAAAADAANVQAGAAKAKEVCAACHGLDGNSPSPDFPKLAGQPADYLAHSLRTYKDGRRKNPIMAGFAAALTAQDIENLSAYYATQPAVVFVEPYTHRVP
jgi:cytochrome c553